MHKVLVESCILPALSGLLQLQLHRAGADRMACLVHHSSMHGEDKPLCVQDALGRGCHARELAGQHGQALQQARLSMTGSGAHGPQPVTHALR